MLAISMSFQKRPHLWISTISLVLSIPLLSVLVWLTPWQWLTDFVRIAAAIGMLPLIVYLGCALMAPLDEHFPHLHEQLMTWIVVGVPAIIILFVWLVLRFTTPLPLINWPYYLFCSLGLIGASSIMTLFRIILIVKSWTKTPGLERHS